MKVGEEWGNISVPADAAAKSAVSPRRPIRNVVLLQFELKELDGNKLKLTLALKGKDGSTQPSFSCLFGLLHHAGDVCLDIRWVSVVMLIISNCFITGGRA